MPGEEPGASPDDGSDAGGDADGSTSDDEQYVIRETEDAETYAQNEGAIERQQGYSIDPIGVGIAVVIVAVAVGLLVVGPLSGSAGGATAPDANWQVSRVNDTHVQLAHVGGESVRAENLALSVNGTERDPGWPDTVEQGEVVLVEADRPARLTLQWTGGEEAERLDQWTV